MISWLQRTSMLTRRRSPVWHALFALLATGIAELLTVLGMHTVNHPAMVGPGFFYLAILIMAFFGNGQTPIALVVIGATLCTYQNNHSWAPGWGLDDAYALVSFTGIAIFGTAIVWSERRARHFSNLHAQEAVAATQAKDRFLAAVSHDLRQPLTGIDLWMRLLRRHADQHACCREMIQQTTDRIENCVRQQLRMVNDLLDTARLSAGKVQLNVMSMALDSPLGDACDQAADGAQCKHVTFIPPQASGIRIYGDRDRLRQVFWNILGNAVKFTEQGGTISVAVQPTPKVVRVVVTDSGCGLTPEEISHVFEPWWQRSDKAGNGLGLGLMISRRLVEMHGGTVEVTSSGQNEGCTFTVSLPYKAIVEPGT